MINAFKAAIAASPSHDTIDIVVAGAGINGAPFLLPNDKPASLDKDPPMPFNAPLTVNTVGLSNTAKLAQHYFSLPSKRSQTASKSLILIGSIGGTWRYTSCRYLQCVQVGVRGFFRKISKPLANSGIRVNLIAPWIMDTPLTQTGRHVSSRGSANWRASRCGKGGLDVNRCVVRSIPKNRRCILIMAILFVTCSKDALKLILFSLGHAFAVDPHRILDLCDDSKCHDGGVGIQEYFRNELPGYEEKIGKLMNMFDF